MTKTGECEVWPASVAVLCYQTACEIFNGAAEAYR